MYFHSRKASKFCPTQGGTDVRSRLLDTAEKLFAERGAAQTGIRDLAGEAGVNVASINYYFGSKENLYLETLRRAFSGAGDAVPRFEELVEHARAAGSVEAAREGIRKYVEAFMSSLFDSDKSQRHMLLMTRELTDPTPALEIIIKEFIAPKANALKSLIALARPDLTDPTALRLSVFSVVGQCLHYRFALPITLNLLGAKEMTPELLRTVAAHIADFSLNALSKP